MRARASNFSHISLRHYGLVCQAPLAMGFSRQEYQSELPFPHPGHHHPGIEPVSPALAGELPLAPTGKLLLKAYFVLNIMLKNFFRFIFKLYKLMTQVVCHHHKRHVVKPSKFLLSYNPVMSVSQSMPVQFAADRVTAFQPPAKEFYALVPRTCCK